jgi:hypothetical protein
MNWRSGDFKLRIRQVASELHRSVVHTGHAVILQRRWYRFILKLDMDPLLTEESPAYCMVVTYLAS